MKPSAPISLPSGPAPALSTAVTPKADPAVYPVTAPAWETEFWRDREKSRQSRFELIPNLQMVNLRHEFFGKDEEADA